MIVHQSFQKVTDLQFSFYQLTYLSIKYSLVLKTSEICLYKSKMEFLFLKERSNELLLSCILSFLLISKANLYGSMSEWIAISL